MNMKIKITEKEYSEVLSIKRTHSIKPAIQKPFFRKLMATLSKPECNAVNFTYTESDMDKLGKDDPALYLMNHSSFTDLQICAQLLKNRQYHIVTTNDGFVGKPNLMKALGCIPTKKFIADPTLVKDMKYCVDKLNSSILMFPEASYTFDGTTTKLPTSIGKCIKLLKIPVVIIKTHGAFLRDPLYNNLQKRKANVYSEISYLLSPEDINQLSVDEINKLVFQSFEYNHFEEQIENNILISEEFRADGLERVLYKCPHCNTEGYMQGIRTTIRCSHCNTTYTLNENGTLDIVPNLKNNDEPSPKPIWRTIPDWYNWERECVKNELSSGNYSFELDVEICVLLDYKSVYKVGTGHLSHNYDGWKLTGCNGQIDFSLPAKASYNLYADYYWYEIGDMISIGDWKCQYYCFPQKKEELLVAKARLATEELYKLKTT